MVHKNRSEFYWERDKYIVYRVISLFFPISWSRPKYLVNNSLILYWSLETEQPSYEDGMRCTE
jgi:hypothetical protein